MTELLADTMTQPPAGESKIGIAVYFQNVEGGRMLFRIENLQYETLAQNVTLDEILESTFWRVFSLVSPLERETRGQPAPDDLAALIEQLRSAAKASEILNRERSVATGARYNDLTGPQGLLVQCEERCKILSYGVDLAMVLTYGVSVRALKDMMT